MATRRAAPSAAAPPQVRTYGAEIGCLAAVAVALMASELCLGLYFAGWAFVLSGMWLLSNDGKDIADPMLVIDFCHAILSKVTLGGYTTIDDHGLLLLHASFHLAMVTCTVVLFGAQKAFSSLVMKLYFTASWLAVLADRGSRELGTPAMSRLAADPTTLGAADLLTTPWHWCLYNLLGGGPSAPPFTFAIVCWTAYCSVRVLLSYPYSTLSKVSALMSAGGDLADAPFGVRALSVVVPAFNCMIIFPILGGRLMKAYRHGKQLAEDNF